MGTKVTKEEIKMLYASVGYEATDIYIGIGAIIVTIKGMIFIEDLKYLDLENCKILATKCISEFKTAVKYVII